jgi:putative flavoprotein involved in K+ transport
VLERSDVANSWRRERWDSLRLLTLNWQSRLTDHRYAGPEPDGCMTMREVTDFIERFAKVSGAPVRAGANVTSVRRSDYIEALGGRLDLVASFGDHTLTVATTEAA